MCEILIRFKDKTHDTGSAEKNRQRWMRGYPVSVLEDGAPWNHSKSYVVIKLPGVAVSAVEDFLEAQTTDDNGTPLTETDGTPKAYRRCNWRVDFDNLPASILNELNTTGEYTVNNPAKLNSLKGQMKRVRDGAAYTGLG